MRKVCWADAATGNAEYAEAMKRCWTETKRGFGTDERKSIAAGPTFCSLAIEAHPDYASAILSYELDSMASVNASRIMD
jgi:hypothetical protein